MLWRWALQSWLNQAARDAVVAGLNSAGERGESHQDAGRRKSGAQDHECDVGIVFALGIEAGGFLDRLSGRILVKGSGFVLHEAGLHGRAVAVLISGAGQEAARRGTEALIAGHRPKFIISSGFAGGLHGDLAKYDILMADSVIGAGGERLSIDLRMDRETAARSRGLHLGPLLTTDRLIRTTEEKRVLGTQHGAVAVDMESLAVAEVCSREKFRCLAVRVISDTVDEELPGDVERLLKQKSAAGRAGAALRAITRRPASFKDMWNLKEQAIVASDRLGQFLEGVVEQLVPIERRSS